MEKPKCAVRGGIRRGAMCGSVMVGGVYCGFNGDCQHKIVATLPDRDVFDDQVEPQNDLQAAAGGLTQTAIEY